MKLRPRVGGPALSLPPLAVPGAPRARQGLSNEAPSPFASLSLRPVQIEAPSPRRRSGDRRMKLRPPFGNKFRPHSSLGATQTSRMGTELHFSPPRKSEGGRSFIFHLLGLRWGRSFIFHRRWLRWARGSFFTTTKVRWGTEVHFSPATVGRPSNEAPSPRRRYVPIEL
jgi:hypothetical protein